jgi:hypothetical protein
VLWFNLQLLKSYTDARKSGWLSRYENGGIGAQGSAKSLDGG